MDIVDRIAQVRNSLGAEALESVKELIGDLEADAKSIVAALKKANSEARDKRIQLEEAKDSHKDLEAQIEVLKRKADTTAKDEEISGLKKKIGEYTNYRREQLNGKITKFQKSKAWEKASKHLSLPDADDGKFDLSEMGEEEITRNLAKISEFEDLGIFGAEFTRDMHGNNYNGGNDFHYDGDPVELAKNDPESYEKYRAKKGFRKI